MTPLSSVKLSPLFGALEDCSVTPRKQMCWRDHAPRLARHSPGSHDQVEEILNRSCFPARPEGYEALPASRYPNATPVMV
jgi:hypothetical protein